MGLSTPYVGLFLRTTPLSPALGPPPLFLSLPLLISLILLYTHSFSIPLISGWPRTTSEESEALCTTFYATDIFSPMSVGVLKNPHSPFPRRILTAPRRNGAVLCSLSPWMGLPWSYLLINLAFLVGIHFASFPHGVFGCPDCVFPPCG